MSRKRNHVIEEFIELYKSEPCLWKISSEDYHNRKKKKAAYEKLVTKLRELEPDATRSCVVKKINNLRGNARREMKKIISSMKTESSPDRVYRSKLWYLNMFDFLGDKDAHGESVSNCDYDEDTGEINQEEIEDNTSPTLTNDEPPRPNGNLSNDAGHDSEKRRKTHFKKSPSRDDRYDLMGKSIATRIRSLERRQGLIVEKRIYDLLFEAEMETLEAPTGSHAFEYLTRSGSLSSSPSSS